ncbi:Predicted secreted protein [Pseudovibrio denitrificans]|uniref:Predicted secreted protein n=1 Tax=Pseudovibrio denitrificans TaxID=258256 RepID=A0A1I7BTT4_9HYPH|nr:MULTISPECIES: DUF1467 family protein [Pseudovibrio]EEA96644.1 hypothetical Membrane Spanning Protein [Pseudovibrio sp. JE062]SFT90608.1 Predicted secreted protein [Pseudovibrio denitrificans]
MATPLLVALYFMMWWILFLAILPFGVRTQAEEGEVIPGTTESAPKNPQLLKKVIINTIVTTIVFAGVYWFLESGLGAQLFPLVDQFMGNAPS